VLRSKVALLCNHSGEHKEETCSSVMHVPALISQHIHFSPAHLKLSAQTAAEQQPYSVGEAARDSHLTSEIPLTLDK